MGFFCVLLLLLLQDTKLNSSEGRFTQWDWHSTAKQPGSKQTSNPKSVFSICSARRVHTVCAQKANERVGRAKPGESSGWEQRKQVAHQIPISEGLKVTNQRSENRSQRRSAMHGSDRERKACGLLCLLCWSASDTRLPSHLHKKITCTPTPIDCLF